MKKKKRIKKKHMKIECFIFFNQFISLNTCSYMWKIYENRNLLTTSFVHDYIFDRKVAPTFFYILFNNRINMPQVMSFCYIFNYGKFCGNDKGHCHYDVSVFRSFVIRLLM